MKIILWAILLPLLCLAQFPTFEELKPQVVFPRGKRVMLTASGDFAVDGKPRHLFGIQIAGQGQANHFAHTPGYAPKNNWIYDAPLGYEESQRLGFDMMDIL